MSGYERVPTASSDIALTLKGERYCVEHDHDRRRAALVDMIERGFALVDRCMCRLDELDGDPDIEENGDELDQSWPEGCRATTQPFEDAEDGGDDEPNLAGCPSDLEADDSDLEPSCAFIEGGGSDA